MSVRSANPLASTVIVAPGTASSRKPHSEVKAPKVNVTFEEGWTSLQSIARCVDIYMSTMRGSSSNMP